MNSPSYFRQVSNSNAGRGVLRLIYIHQCIKLLDIIAICIAVAILLHPEEKLSPMLCLYFEALVGFIRIDYYMAGFTIAFGRLD